MFRFYDLIIHFHNFYAKIKYNYAVYLRSYTK